MHSFLLFLSPSLSQIINFGKQLYHAHSFILCYVLAHGYLLLGYFFIAEDGLDDIFVEEGVVEHGAQLFVLALEFKEYIPEGFPECDRKKGVFEGLGDVLGADYNVLFEFIQSNDQKHSVSASFPFVLFQGLHAFEDVLDSWWQCRVFEVIVDLLDAILANDPHEVLYDNDEFLCHLSL